MKAAWYERTGDSSVLADGKMPIPEPGLGEVRVGIYASGIQNGDIKKWCDWMGFGLAYPCVIPHSDGAGVIDAVRERVPDTRIGERVWVYGAQSGRPFGTAAEYVVVPSAQAVPLPANFDLAAGAVLGIPARTAHRCLFWDGPVQGQTVLVGGGAGTGSPAIRPSTAVWRTCRPRRCAGQWKRPICGRGPTCRAGSGWRSIPIRSPIGDSAS